MMDDVMSEVCDMDGYLFVIVVEVDVAVVGEAVAAAVAEVLLVRFVEDVQLCYYEMFVTEETLMELEQGDDG